MGRPTNPPVAYEHDTDYTHFGELLGVSGMSREEAVAFLTARGHKVSIGAVKAWLRDVYNPPLVVLDEMWLLVDAVLDESIVMPAEAPACTYRRRNAINTMRDTYNERHPDPDLIPQPGEEL